MINSNKFKAAGVAAAVALLLSGCSGLGYGNAAMVNEVKISSDEAAKTADLLCTLTALGPEATSRALVNKRALATLIDFELTQQYAESEGIKADPARVKALAQQRLELADEVPSAQRAAFKDIITRSSEANDLLLQAGAKLTNQPVSLDNTQKLLEAGQLGRLKWEKDTSAKVDSASSFAPGKDGWPSNGVGSVSVASSQFAKDADVKLSGQQEDAKWVASLPKSQRCG